jgi:hypothetical protein
VREAAATTMRQEARKARKDRLIVKKVRMIVLLSEV